MNNIINIRNSKSISTTGTSLVGHLSASYDELVNLFGEPTYFDKSADNKVTTEWTLEFETTNNSKPYVIGTIYDWKTYDYNVCRDGVYNWHVGGLSTDAIDSIDTVRASGWEK